MARSPLGVASACSLVLLDPQTSNIYNITCIRYSVSADCKLGFCCSVLYQRHLLHVCPSWERDASPVALPEVSSIFIFSLLKAFTFFFFFYQ